MKVLTFFIILLGLSSVSQAAPCPRGKQNPRDLRYVNTFYSGRTVVYGYYFGQFTYTTHENGKTTCSFSREAGANYCGWSGKKPCVFDPDPQPAKYYAHSNYSTQWYNGYGPQPGAPKYDSQDGHYVGNW